MLSLLEERAVIGGLRDGDRTAWTTLYDQYSGDVWRYVARLVGHDAAGVADVVQEAFLAAARSAHAFDPQRGSLGSWLLGIAHHQASAYWKERGRAARLEHLFDSGAIDVGRLLNSAEPIGDLLERRELVDFVRYVLAELPSDYAQLLTAKYLHEHTLEEIADQQASSVDAVKSKLARARREFRTKFERLSSAGSNLKVT